QQKQRLKNLGKNLSALDTKHPYLFNERMAIISGITPSFRGHNFRKPQRLRSPYTTVCFGFCKKINRAQGNRFLLSGSMSGNKTEKLH
ncbi:MAG: hypothetical protein AAF572_24985, partial [Cyanobacteria bacterium P01_B01_bin.77]